MARGRGNGNSQLSDWTNWLPIDTESDYTGPANYEVRLTTGEGAPVPIPRFLSHDSDGLLLIGRTGRMENRRRQFICAMNICHGHSEGNLFHLLTKYTPLKGRFPGYRIEFRYHRKENQAAAKSGEERLIKRYVRQFGEVPPLNSTIPNRYGRWELENSEGRD